MDPIPRSNEKENSPDPRVESLAIPLARDYAEKNYPKRADGTLEPAWRGSNGEEDLRGKSPDDVKKRLEEERYSPEAAFALAQLMVVDIANTPYDQFPDYWKEQNRGGAEFLIGLVDEVGADKIRALDLSDSEVQKKYGALIHTNWISRNQWVLDPEYGNPDLAKSFEELAAEEQQKDLDQLRVLQGWLNDQLLDEFEYSSEEKEEYPRILGLIEEAKEELVAKDPASYDVNHPDRWKDCDRKGTAIRLYADAEDLVEKQIGKHFDRRRLCGYEDIVTGVPRSSIEYRFKDRY